MGLSTSHGWTVVSDDDARTPGVLERAWGGPSSVLLAPSRRGVDAAWFEAALALVPARFATGHYALLTSGSTGAPKLVVGEKERTRRLASVIHKAQDDAPARRTVVLLPLTYSYAFVNQWVWAREFGRAIEVTGGASDWAHTHALLRDGAEAMVCLVGPLFGLLQRSLPAGATLPAVTRLNFAGGAFPHEHLDAVRAMFPNARVFNNYGCAEALPRLAITPADALEGPGDVGLPLPGVRLRVDEAGELRFQSDYGAVGVVEAGVWRPVMPDDWTGTGDLAEAADGRYRLVGRRSEVYKRYGEKVSRAQQLAAVREVWPGQAATLPAVDGAGEAGHVLVLSPAPGEAEVRAVLKLYRARFPRAHWPLRVESTDEIPVSPNGKVDAEALAGAPRRVHWQQPA